MSSRFPLLLLLIAAAPLVGCRTSPHVASFIENRNAEARQLEDDYWYQVQENERLAHELAKVKRQKAKAEAAAPGELSPPIIEEGTTPPAIDVPDTPSPPAERTRPRIEAEPAPRPDGSRDDDPPAELPPPKGTGPARNVSAEEEIVDHEVTRLFLNPLHTGGIDWDNHPGDDGLTIVLEPRNAANQFVPQAGNVSIVLLDPAKSGDAARIARWNFSAAETKTAIRPDGDARGIHLEVPWPSRAPENSQLKLFVRYEGPSGRKMQAEREIFIKLAGQYSERWTPRPPERQRRNPPFASAPAANEPTSREPAALPSPTVASPSAPPPPALSDPAGQAPRRPTWKPYR